MASLDTTALRRTVAVLLAAALVLVGLVGVGTAGPAARAATGDPALGPNVTVFDPEHADQPRSRPPSTRSAAQQVDNEMGTPALRVAVQARHLRHGRRSR